MDDVDAEHDQRPDAAPGYNPVDQFSGKLQQRGCLPCEVTWAGEPECWVCGGEATHESWVAFKKDWWGTVPKWRQQESPAGAGDS